MIRWLALACRIQSGELLIHVKTRLASAVRLRVISSHIERWSVYRHILIPTDGSELAERAVTHGLSLAKSVGAKVTVIIAEERLGGWLYTEQIKEHTASVLDRAADAAKQAGVPCDTIHVQDVQPYEAIIATATDRGCDLIVIASHGRSGLSAARRRLTT
jgi:nucleotide-binding universal stress UspA family protein